MPQIKYITNPKKAAIVVTHALDDTLDYAAQFADTQSLFGKAKSFGNRKYYHFKHSFDPKDNVSPAEASQMTEELARQVFDDFEYIIATHTDKAHVHCHLIVNSVSFETGRMLHFNNAEYAELKDLSNSIAVSHGYSDLDFRKAAADKISSQENRVTLKGGTSWKEDLREVIALAVKECSAIDEFEVFINEYGEEITRNTEKTISFKHPKNKNLSGEKNSERTTRRRRSSLSLRNMNTGMEAPSRRTMDIFYENDEDDIIIDNYEQEPPKWKPRQPAHRDNTSEKLLQAIYDLSSKVTSLTMDCSNSAKQINITPAKPVVLYQP